jgi:hypothetical protein
MSRQIKIQAEHNEGRSFSSALVDRLCKVFCIDGRIEYNEGWVVVEGYGGGDLEGRFKDFCATIAPTAGPVTCYFFEDGHWCRTAVRSPRRPRDKSRRESRKRERENT